MIFIYDLGLRLKELRERKKLTQSQVGKKLNCNKSAISAYENNIRQPSIDVLSQLAMIYNTDPNYILGFDKNKTICVDNLTDKQIQILKLTITEFKNSNTKM